MCGIPLALKRLWVGARAQKFTDDGTLVNFGSFLAIIDPAAGLPPGSDWQ